MVSWPKQGSNASTALESGDSQAGGDELEGGELTYAAAGCKGGQLEKWVVTLSAFRPKRQCGNLLGRSHYHGGHHGRSCLVRIRLSQPQVPSVWATWIALDPPSRLVQQAPQHSLPPLHRLRPEFLRTGRHALLPLPTPPRENRRHRPACGRRQRHAIHGPSVWRESEHRLADRRARRPTRGGVSRRESLPCPSAPGAGR